MHKQANRSGFVRRYQSRYINNNKADIIVCNNVQTVYCYFNLIGSNYLGPKLGHLGITTS